MRRGLLMQGLLFQAGLAVLLVGMAFLSRDQPLWLGAYLWSLIVPAGVAFAFYRANGRIEKLPPEDAIKGEAREGKAALGLIAMILIAWVAGLGVLLLIF